MEEADPAALTRALQVEAHTQLYRSRDRAAADSLMARVAAATAAAAAAASGAEGAKPPTPLSDPAGWDVLAAWLDVKVAGRVYARGSGERHMVRMPTYPAFEVRAWLLAVRLCCIRAHHGHACMGAPPSL
jgi:hypothetical protein